VADVGVDRVLPGRGAGGGVLLLEAGVSRRRREDYEELARLIIEAEEAVAWVQGKLTGIFPAQGPDSRPRATQYEELALQAQRALKLLEEQLELERQNEMGRPKTPPAEGRR
jgi:hypothetical protein